ncbi:MAG TPA: hypothetical protein PKA80_08935 [Ignavibacteriaceae bacterium]|nr:hypothetical protein [Ignavibacteriaceae bacterium]
MKLIKTFVLLIILLPALQASAQEIGLEKLNSRFQSFNYYGVISLSDTLLQNKDELPAESLINVYLLRGISFYSIAKEDSARSSFIEILNINPEYSPNPSEISPKIINLFEKIRSDFIKIKGNANTKNEVPDSITTFLSNPGLLKIEKDIFSNAVIRSALLPGFGHLYLKQDFKGWFLTSISAASISSMIYFIFDSNKKQNSYLNETDLNLIQNKYDTYNSAYKIRNTLIVTSVVLWLYSQIDLLFFSDDLFAEKLNAEITSDLFHNSPSNISLNLKFNF